MFRMIVFGILKMVGITNVCKSRKICVWTHGRPVGSGVAITIRGTDHITHEVDESKMAHRWIMNESRSNWVRFGWITRTKTNVRTKWYVKVGALKKKLKTEKQMVNKIFDFMNDFMVVNFNCTKKSKGRESLQWPKIGFRNISLLWSASLLNQYYWSFQKNINSSFLVFAWTYCTHWIHLN